MNGATSIFILFAKIKEALKLSDICFVCINIPAKAIQETELVTCGITYCYLFYLCHSGESRKSLIDIYKSAAHIYIKYIQAT